MTFSARRLRAFTAPPREPLSLQNVCVAIRRAPQFADHPPWPFGGSPRIYAGEERFSAPKGVVLTIMRFSAGPREIPGLKSPF